MTSDKPRSPGPFERDPRDAGNTPGGRSRPRNSGAETSLRALADLVVDVGAASPNKANKEGTYSFESLSVLNLVVYQKAKVETDQNNLHSAIKGLKLVEIEQKQMPFGGRIANFLKKIRQWKFRCLSMHHRLYKQNRTFKGDGSQFFISFIKLYKKVKHVLWQDGESQ